MYSKSKTGINGTMGVINNNIARRNIGNLNGGQKGDYEPGANYNKDRKISSYAKPQVGKASQEPKASQGMAPRPNSKIQPRGVGSATNAINAKSPNVPSKKDFTNIIDSTYGAKDNSNSAKEIEKLNQQIAQMKKVIVEKDTKIETQRTEITNLRTKNFEFRSQVQELKDKNKERKENRENRQSETNASAGADALRQLQMAMQMQSQEVKNRERDIMMQVMMNSLAGAHSAEAEEERLLQRALEESKADAPNDPNNPNTDNMTYEQLIELEEANGKVSKGLKPVEISRIPEKTWMRKTDTSDESCSICFDNFERMQKIRRLVKCGHEYHSTCIKKWLTDQKRCPVCNEDVL